MTGFAATPREARQAFVSAFPFELVNGGLGTSLPLTDVSGHLPLVGEGAQVLVTNTGTVPGYIRFGISTVAQPLVATLACQVIMPGIPYTLTIPADATDVAGIAGGATTTIQITRGYGN